jgi:hypothetical protein
LLDHNNFDFFGINFNIINTNNKFKIFYVFDFEFIFFNINLQVYLLKTLNNFLYIYNVLKFIFEINQNIIEINYNKIIKIIKEYIIDIILKYNRIIN